MGTMRLAEETAIVSRRTSRIVVHLTSGPDHRIVPFGTTHSQAWPVISAIRSKSAS